MVSSEERYFTPESKMLELVSVNYELILFLEHFQIDFAIGDLTVRELCTLNHIHEPAFITIGNLYNGIFPSPEDLESITDITPIIRFLQNSHEYYTRDKYPEIKNYLDLLQERHTSKDIVLLEKFFADYYNEVQEHLEYEEQVAFPYFYSLLGGGESGASSDYKAREYREHHSDIETKLSDLKNLMLKHISIEGDLGVRRRFLFSLFRLEADLNIHSLIEERVLLPLVEAMEH